MKAPLVRSEMAEQDPDIPEVSVVIPTYNRADVLPRAIESVRRQTFGGVWELIVVDDASTDRTEEVVRTFGDARIRYLRHTENRYGAAARNTGIRAARGEWIAFLDSDDEWLPHHLERKVALLEDAGADAVFGSFFVERDHRRTSVRCDPLQGGSMAEYILGSTPGDVATPTMVFRADAIRDILFDETLQKHQDWDLAIRFSHRYSFMVDPEATVVVHPTDPERMSARLNHEATAHFLRQHAHELSLPTLAHFYFMLAYQSRRFEGRTRETRRYLRKAWTYRQSLPRTMRLLLLVLQLPIVDAGALGAGEVFVRVRRWMRARPVRV